MPELAFIVTNSPNPPNPASIMSKASANGLGLELTPTDHDDVTHFRLEGGEDLTVTFVRAQIPDLDKYPGGPTSANPTTLCQAANHLVLQVPGFTFEPATIRLIMSVLCAAVASETDAVGILIGDGVVFHRPDVFLALAQAGATEPSPPTMLMVEVTASAEPNDRMSLLSHGLARVGRDEEVYVTCPQAGAGAMDFTHRLIESMANDPSLHYETGDTIGRSGDEKIVVIREPNPAGQGLPVLRLDLVS